MVLTLFLGGDVNVQGRAPGANALAGLSPLLDAADVRFVNLEGLLVEPSGDPGLLDIPHKANWRHSGPGAIASLTAAGIDAVSCANNVAFPPAAVLASLAVLEEAGIGHAGAGSTAALAHQPCIVTRQQVRFGLLAYSSIVYPYGHAADERSPGIAPIRATTAYVPDPRAAEVPGRPPTVLTEPVQADLARLVSDVETARSRCDVLVVSIHWGVQGHSVCDYQPVLGRAALDAGADVVMGHGPHSVLGVEIHNGKPILYSLGNLAFDWPVMRGRHREGLVALGRFDSGRLSSVELHPVRRDEDNDIGLPAPSVAREILDLVEALSPLASPHMERHSAHLTLHLPTHY